MHMDPLMPQLVGVAFFVLIASILLQRFKQPSLVAYLVTGALLGPRGFGLVTDTTTIARLGEVGVVLLLFFAGMELSLPELKKQWRIPILGTLMQIAASVGFVAAIGWWMSWPLGRVVLLGFVVSLSSTAVVLKLLHDRGELDGPVGRDVVGILLAQDIAIIPMLMTIGFLAGSSPSPMTLGVQLVAGICVIVLLGFIASRDSIHLPLGKWLRGDRELQVLAAFALAFGLAFLTGVAGLSVALGAFVGGVVVGAARETEWIHQVLYPFQVFFLAVFFVSIGMMIDPRFVWNRFPVLFALLVAVLVTNTVVNGVILRLLGRSWSNSLRGGALLAQIGEFSFVLAAVGRQTGLIEDFAYQTTVAVIALTLLVSPSWIRIAELFRRKPGGPYTTGRMG
ncbi:MAG: cation:proton antiporter [Myxococcales bacterium]|nr:cation:proton antiporter [Myxococcales bacterium]